MKKAMRRYGSPNEIVTDKLWSYSVAAKELDCLEKQVIKRWAKTERRLHIHRFDEENLQCCDLGGCTACKN